MTGAELRAIRAELGKTQGALASDLGIGQRTVQQYEAEDRSIPETIARVVRAVLVHPELLEWLRGGA